MFANEGLGLIYFTSDPYKGASIVGAGASALLLDCETAGKTLRQRGFDTQINYNTPEQIKYIRSVNPDVDIMCRVNSAEDLSSESQILSAIKYGVNTIVLPLVEAARQVVWANRVINNRAKLIIMIETQNGVDNFDTISREMFDGVYVGLNDLSISRGGEPLFAPLKDGTVESLIARTSKPVGVGGVTDPSKGYPVKSELIISEYARLGVKFTVLRRSFENAILSKPASSVIKDIKETHEKYRHIQLQLQRTEQADLLRRERV